MDKDGLCDPEEHHYVPILNGTVMWCTECGDSFEPTEFDIDA